MTVLPDLSAQPSRTSNPGARVMITANHRASARLIALTSSKPTSKSRLAVTNMMKAISLCFR